MTHRFSAPVTLLLLVLCLLIPAAHAQIALPAAAPVDVYSQVKDKGYGTIFTNVDLLLTDEPYGVGGLDQEVTIGTAQFAINGLIYTKAERSGNRFETSYIIGRVSGKLANRQFSRNGDSYNNTYDKSGLYLGYRPAYSGDLHDSDALDVKYAYTLYSMFYYLSGDYTVDATLAGGTTGQYGYDETSFGVALKPTAIVQSTWHLFDHLALTVYGGGASFLALDNAHYTAKPINGYPEDDSELALYFKAIKPIYGYDITFKGIFSENDTFNLSSTLSFGNDESEDLSEVVVVYSLPFL